MCLKEFESNSDELDYPGMLMRCIMEASQSIVRGFCLFIFDWP